MSAWKKLLAAPSGAAALDVDEVFSTYLYKGNNSTNTITNGIDLDGEGGLWWLKRRTGTGSHVLYDSTRATGSEHFPLFSNLTNAEYDDFDTTPTSTGFTINSTSSGTVNETGQTYVSWSWRKAPKFFDVVTYTGNGSSQNISHNLGSVPGMVMVKATSAAANWAVWHRESNASPEYKHLQLNTTGAALTSSTVWNSTNPTDSVFSVGNYYNTNSSGVTYVAYLFAHNNADGEFGPDSDQDIIKCGSYTGVYAGAEVNLGWQPQWILFKSASSAGNWYIFDAMRGIVTGGLSGDGDAALLPNTSGAENVNTFGIDLTATGFITYGNNVAATNDMIYMAIRRGPLAPPEAGTEVFGIKDRYSEGSLPTWQPGFVTDMAMRKRTSGSDSYIYDRLRQGKELAANATSTEATSSNTNFDYMTGWGDVTSASSGDLGWNWKRAPSYFDVVAYNGDATSSPNSRNINHNLGVAPEMMWIKCRTAAENWAVYHSGTGATKYLNLNNTAAAATSANWWRNTAPTDTVFTIGHQDDVNLNGGTHIAYLFATLAGVSKVGSYTGNGSSQTIDCGFSSGARFVYVKRTDSSGDWYIWDTTRGIIAGNDPHLSLNTTAAQVTSDDSIDPASSGFAVNQVSATNINVSSATYIFYAIA